MLQVESISKYYTNKVVLDGVSFGLESNEIVGIVGPSGSGKSVLLKMLGGVIEPDAGEIDFSEAHRSGLSFQEGGLFDSLSVIENVAFPLLEERRVGKKRGREEIYQVAKDILEQVGLAAAVKKYPGQLSGGMRRRVGIARALVSNPDLVLLDEPTEGLDPVAASVIMNLVKKLHQAYRPATILVSHDLRRLLPAVDRVIALFGGKVLCDLPRDKLKEEAPPEVIRFLSTRYDFD